MNQIVLYQESAGVVAIPETNDVATLMSFNRSLSNNDANKIVKAFDNGLYDMAVE